MLLAILKTYNYLCKEIIHNFGVLDCLIVINSLDFSLCLL